ncbi:MAG: response regulator [Cyclobacteriaceae bacterium]|nr:response regulator [Cyclobacteriaceae bacterium]
MTLFYADDDPDEIELFGYALRAIDESIEFITAKNGEEALVILQLNEPPTFIFLDINMPRRNGMEVLVDIRKISHLRDVPVMIYSSTTDEKQMKEAVKLGATKFISKPSSVRELSKLLKSVLGVSPGGVA